MHDLSYAEAIKKAEHLIALGHETVILYPERHDFSPQFPFDKVTHVEVGNAFRLNGPTSCYLCFEEAGLKFKAMIEFECRDADGKSVSMFDTERLRSVAMRLSAEGRLAFAKMFEEHVLRALSERTAEFRKALHYQMDSEDCIRGLIAFARETDDAA